MAKPSDNFQLRKGFFHALSRVNLLNTQNSFESLYKSAHSITSKDVWLDTIGFATLVTDADNFTGNNPNIVRKYHLYALKEVPGTNNQAYYLEDPDTSIFVRPFISPLDVPDPITNQPSDGYRVRLYDSNFAPLTPTTGVWMCDYYSGIILFQEGYTPIDLNWALPIKIACYVYVGKTLENFNYEIKQCLYTVSQEYIIGENINLVNGQGSIGGLATPTGNTLSLGSDNTIFNRATTKFYQNGVMLNKNVDVEYISDISIRINIPLEKEDIFTVEYF